MGTATQIVHLKRLALTTSRHLPHNHDWSITKTNYKQFMKKESNPDTQRSWFQCYEAREEVTVASLNHLIGRNME